MKVTNKQQASKLLTQARIADIDIKVTPHRSLNSSQGVISEPDLANETEANLLEGLRDQGLTAVRRITMRRDNQQIPTKDIILTFDRSTRPESKQVSFDVQSDHTFLTRADVSRAIAMGMAQTLVAAD